MLRLKNETMRQFIRFSIVGMSNTAVSYMIYLICLKEMEMREWFSQADYLISSMIAFLLSVLWSFWWNNKFTFREEIKKNNGIWGSLLKTYVSYSVTGLFLNNMLLYLIVEQAEISKGLAPFFCLLVTVPLNFLLNKYWVFKKQNDKNNYQ